MNPAGRVCKGGLFALVYGAAGAGEGLKAETGFVRHCGNSDLCCSW
jgi:hypothetical protein